MGKLNRRKSKRQRTAKPSPREGYVTIVMNGHQYTIAPDARQPGAEARLGPGVRIVGSVFRNAQELRARDAAIQ